MKRVARHARRFGWQALTLVAALSIGGAGIVSAQEQENQERQQGESHRGRVAAIEDGKLVMTVDGRNRHTHQVPENAKVTLNGESAELQDLQKGDRIEVTTEKNNPNVALVIKATRNQEQAEDRQRDRQHDGAQRRTFRSQDEPRAQRDRRAEDGQPWLGVLLQPDEQGVRVVQVHPSSPADRAGLRPGDLLIAMDGREFQAPEDVSEAISGKQPGANVEFTIERRGQEREVQARLGSRPQMRDERGFPGFPGGRPPREVEEALRDFRGFGPDRQLMQDHQQIQREHQQLKQQVQSLQQEVRELRRQLDQLRRNGGGQEGGQQQNQQEAQQQQQN